MDDHPPKLPAEFQDAFELAKTKADLKYARRADAFPHHPQFAEPPLHRIIRVQEEFFAYCTQARNAFRAGVWTIAEASCSIDCAWPAIFRAYYDRELGASTEDAAKLRTATWRTISDDQRWKQHLSELVTIEEVRSKAPAGSHEAHISVVYDQVQEVARGMERAKTIETFHWRDRIWELETFYWKGQKCFKCSLCPYENCVLNETLQHRSGSEHHHDFFREDKHWEMDKLFRQGRQIFKCRHCPFESLRPSEVADHSAEQHVPMTQAEPLTPNKPRPVAINFTDGNSNHNLSTSQGSKEERLSAALQTPSIQESPSAQPEAEANIADTRATVDSIEGTGSSGACDSSEDHATTQSGWAERIDDFLRRCNLEPHLGARIIRTHIWRSVGHTHARQFQYWQAKKFRTRENGRGATESDIRNFSRILALTPAEFVADLKAKRLI